MGMNLRLVIAAVCFAVPVFAQSRDYGRSMVITQQGIVATSQTLASQAGAQILAKGGSAVDAAIAANAVLGVVEPMMNGIGGDMFAIYWDAKTGKLTGLNASGPAPHALSAELLTRQGFQSIPEGIHSVTVPGAVDGWAKMHARFGKLPWKDLFQAAIAYAEEGFPVTEDANATGPGRPDPCASGWRPPAYICQEAVHRAWVKFFATSIWDTRYVFSRKKVATRSIRVKSRTRFSRPREVWAAP